MKNFPGFNPFWPWLLQIGIQGFEAPAADLPAANLVFLIDASGSMQAANKLELLKSSLRLLLRRLDTQDRIAIVVYASAPGVVLEPTPGDQSAKIIAAQDGLAAAVAAFGQLLRGARYTGDFTCADVLILARNARGADPFGYRGEFLQLAGLASMLNADFPPAGEAADAVVVPVCDILSTGRRACRWDPLR